MTQQCLPGESTPEGSTVQHRKSLTSITDLPSELLSIIFRFAHQNTSPIQREKYIIPTWMRMEGREGFKQSVMALAHPTIFEDPKSPTLFPYSLAAVCSFWRDVLCAYPEFWTLVVLFIDSKPTSTVEASLFLEWSQNHQIDVFITRRDQLRATSHPDLHEKHHVDALVSILKPHLHRCRSLHIETHLSSSLPVVHETFKGIEALYLKSMKLVCDTHHLPDGKGGRTNRGSNLEGHFKPDLTHLIIDGNNFRQTSHAFSDWMVSHRSLKQIAVANYEPNRTDFLGYCIEDILEYLNARKLPLNQLRFDGLEFAFDHDGDPYSQISIRIPYIHLQDVSEDFITHLSDFGDFDPISLLRITRCPLPDFQIFEGLPETLILEDISSEIDLLDAISSWNGENLWLDRCHSFSSAFLKALGSGRRLEYPCRRLCRLLLYRLPKFSISSLKKMLEKRNAGGISYEDDDEAEPDWPNRAYGPAISSLAVVHCGMQELSIEDDDWFRSRLVEFYWIC